MEHFVTHTFTARSIKDPEKVATFTLFGNTLRVNMTGTLSRLEKISQSDQKAAELGKQIAKQVTPTVMNLVEYSTGPVNVADVSASAKNGHFKISGWKRILGLRLFPFRINMGKIDNPVAAENFVDELKARKRAVENKQGLAGPFDYWVGWAALLFTGAIVVRSFTNRM